jgi:putative thiamine transport system permease protein
VLRLFPVVTLAVFLAPVAAGWATALPAFGYLPALGGHQVGGAPGSACSPPGFWTSVHLTVQSGLLATVLRWRSSSVLQRDATPACSGGPRSSSRRCWPPPCRGRHRLGVFIALAGWASRLVSRG